jgi:hypothetical protein
VEDFCWFSGTINIEFVHLLRRGFTFKRFCRHQKQNRKIFVALDSRESPKESESTTPRLRVHRIRNLNYKVESSNVRCLHASKPNICICRYSAARGHSSIFSLPVHYYYYRQSVSMAEGNKRGSKRINGFQPLLGIGCYRNYTGSQ